MNIFVIFLLLIIIFNLKIKISICFKLNNFDAFFVIKVGYIKFTRKGTLVKRKKKYIEKNKFSKFIKKKVFNKDKMLKLIKVIEIDNLNLNILVGSPFMFFTIFAVPILGTFFELVKTIPFKKIKRYYYNILPNYDEFKLRLEGEIIGKIRIIDLVKFMLPFRLKLSNRIKVC